MESRLSLLAGFKRHFRYKAAEGLLSSQVRGLAAWEAAWLDHPSPVRPLSHTLFASLQAYGALDPYPHPCLFRACACWTLPATRRWRAPKRRSTCGPTWRTRCADLKSRSNPVKPGSFHFLLPAPPCPAPHSRHALIAPTPKLPCPPQPQVVSHGSTPFLAAIHFYLRRLQSGLIRGGRRGVLLQVVEATLTQGSLWMRRRLSATALAALEVGGVGARAAAPRAAVPRAARCALAGACPSFGRRCPWF
jgi:hypothetical protein